MNSRLAPHHLAELRDGSGISPEVIAARGAFTAYQAAELEARGYKGDQVRVPALVFPEHLLNGWEPTFHIKPDNPRVDEVRPDGTVKYQKYDRPVGSANRLDVPPTVRDKVMDYDEPLIFTEGWKKADAAASHGMAVVALGGTWNYAGRTEDGWMAPLEDLRHIPLKMRGEKGRRVLIVFDSDVRINQNVRDARERLYHLLMGYGARVQHVDFEPLPDGGKCGLDDFLLTHTPADVWALAYDPQEERFAAMQRKLDEAQAELDRHRDEYKWQRDLDTVDNKALSPADKLVLRDIRRATRRAGEAAYRDPQTLFYPERVKHTGQSPSSYSRSLQELEKAGAIELVEGVYPTSGKKKISVRLRPTFDTPATIRRADERKSGGLRPRNVPVCEECGPGVGVLEIKATTTSYACAGCENALQMTTQRSEPVDLVRSGIHPEECIPPEPPPGAETPTVSNMQRMGIEGEPTPTHRYPVRCKNETVTEPPLEEPGYWESLTALPTPSIGDRQ
jgi:hypothetical protein